MDYHSLLSALEEEASLETAIAKNATELVQATRTTEGTTVVDQFIEDTLNSKGIRCLKDDGTKFRHAPSSSSSSDEDGDEKPPKSVLRKPNKPIPGVDEANGDPVKVYYRERFKNWGSTIKTVYPKYTFLPKTRKGVVNIVKYARANNLRVRCAGTRHSWSEVYGKSGEVMISMVPLGAAKPILGVIPSANPQKYELQNINFVSKAPDGESALVKIGGAATSDHFRLWCLSKEGGNWSWMIPALPILVEITSAGWTQPICHGAGIDHPCTSDMVTEIEFVNVFGKIQTVSNPEQLKAAAGSFGMIGVILSQTFRVQKMRLAEMNPRCVPTPLAIPPISREDVPDTTDFDISRYSDEQIEDARIDFIKDAHKFYSEWFWFPFQKDCWLNCWDTIPYDPKKDKRPEYLTSTEVQWQFALSNIGEIFQRTGLRLVPGVEQARLFGATAMSVLPNDEKITTSVSDAVHFRRGIHNMQVQNFELEIPLPVLEDGSIDFSIAQKAWWIGIRQVYKEQKRGKSSMRIALEMRVFGKSEMILAPQRGNEATAAIEVLTNPITNRKDWMEFIEDLVNEWASLTHPITGKRLNVRPHWAKEWPRRILGAPTKHYLHSVYKDVSVEFNEQLAEISKEGGYELEEMLSMFGNDTMLEILNGPNPTPHGILSTARKLISFPVRMILGE